MKGILGSSVALSALAWSFAAQAQSAAPTPEANAVDDESGLEEIIVTAQRVEESSQRAPLAIDVISPDELARQNVIRAEDLSRTTPALSATGSTGGPTTVFFVRGVGNTTVNAYSDPAISFNYDGVYIGRPSSTSGVFYDLQRVEVLKGPQGTLYGRNATAGAINVIPNRPRLGDTSLDVSLGYGNFDWLTGQAAINLPVGDLVAVRVAGSMSRRDGFQSDGTGRQREYAGRFQIYAEPTDRLSLRLGADVSHQGGDSISGFYLGAVDPTFGPTGFAGYSFTPTGFSPDQGLLDPASNALQASRFIAQAGRAGAVVDGMPFNDNDYWGITAELNYETDAGTLTIQPAYREADLEYQINGVFRAAYSAEKDKQTSIEARWAGNIGDTVDYLLGAIYFEEDISAVARYNQQTLNPYQSFTTGTESWAGFGKVTFNVTDQLSLTLGGRYTSDKKDFQGASNVYVLFCGNPAPPQDFCPNLPFIPLVETEQEFIDFYTSRGIPITPVPLFALPPEAGGSQTAPFVLRSPIVIDSELKNDKFTYRLAAQYDLTPRNMLYASFETGYHAGGFSFARGVESYRPESIKAFTLGSKNRFFGNTLQLNLEAFLWKYKDQQFSQFGYDLGTPPTTVFLTRNIGDSTIMGLDLEADFKLTRNTLLSAKRPVPRHRVRQLHLFRAGPRTAAEHDLRVFPDDAGGQRLGARALRGRLLGERGIQFAPLVVQPQWRTDHPVRQLPGRSAGWHPLSQQQLFDGGLPAVPQVAGKLRQRCLDHLYRRGPEQVRELLRAQYREQPAPAWRQHQHGRSRRHRGGAAAHLRCSHWRKILIRGSE